MTKTLALSIFLFLPALVFSQSKYDNVWVTGEGTNFANHGGGTKIDFNTGIPAFTHFSLPYHFGFNMPCSISDEEGNLQFYANGCQIVNYDNIVMENGDDLSPGYFQSIECDNFPYAYDSYQDMLILPLPEHPGRYVYFHHTFEMDISSGKILYSEVDMNANNGKGKVIKKNQVLRGPVDIEGAFTAVKHGNGRDWWIVIPQEYVNVYNLYLLSPDGIMGPFTQDWEDNEAAMFIKTGWNVFISPDGKKIGRVTLSNGFNRIFLYDFDRCTGTLSNPQVIKVDDPAVYASWAAISPNSRFLYFQIAQNKLFQYDLHASNIEASRQLIAEYDGFTTPQGFSTAFHAMALAPNNKIYMCCANGIYYYHTIHKPDRLGLGCDFRQHDLELPTVNSTQMPLYPNFRLGPIDNSPCDTLGLDNLPVSHFRWEENAPISLLQIEFTDLSYYEPATWLWNFGDGSTSLDTSPVHLYTVPGTYQVCLTVCNANDCNTSCQEVTVKLVNTVTIKGESESVLLWPNPVVDLLHFQAEGTIDNLRIFNATGQDVSKITYTASEGQMSMDVHELQPGLYYLNLQAGSKVLTGRFVKM